MKTYRLTSRSPIQRIKCLYGDVDVNTEESNLKLQKSVKLKNVKWLTQEQPHRNPSKCACEVVGLRCQHGSLRHCRLEK